jgi:hypothetical protein
VHHEVPLPAGAELERPRGGGEPLRSPPPRQVPHLARVRKQAEDARDRVLAKAGVTDPGSWIPEVYAAPEE